MLRRSIRWCRPRVVQVTALILVPLTGFAVSQARATAVSQQEFLRAFPEPSKVIADFSDDAQRCAAMDILYYTFRDNMVPDGPEKAKKLLGYMQGCYPIEAKYSRKPVSGSPHVDLIRRRNKLAFFDPHFRSVVLERYGLVHLTEARTLGALELVFILVLFTFVTTPFVPAVIAVLPGGRAPSGSESGVESGDPLQLPESLRAVRVVGKRYGVAVFRGQVIEKDTTVETDVNTTARGGGQFGVQVDTRVTSTQKDTIWVRTLNGRETSWTFYGGKFKARQGHIISAIATQRRFLVAYNHTTGQFVTFDGNVQRENQVPILKAWLASIAWGTAGCAAALVLGLMNKTEALWKGGDYTTPVFVGAVWLFFFSTLFVGPPLLITAWIFSKLRNQRFQRLWAPAFHAFLQERTPELVQRFRPLPER